MSIFPHVPVPERDPSTVGAGRVRPSGVSLSAVARAQRAELHLDLSDALLISLAVKAGKSGGAR